MLRLYSRLCPVAWAAVALLVLSGCSMTTMRDTQFPHPTAVVVVDVSQQEVGVDRQNTAGSQVGALNMLLASAIEGQVNKNAEEASSGLRDRLAGLDVSEFLAARFEEAEIGRVFADEPDVRMVRVKDSWWQEKGEGRFVAVLPFIGFANLMDALLVTVEVREGVWDEEKQEVKSTGLRASYEYAMPIREPESGRGRDDYAAAWLELEDGAIRGYIEQGVDVVIEMVREHVRLKELPESTPRVRSQEFPRATLNVPAFAWTGNLWKEDDGLVLFSFDNMRMMALPREFVEIKN